MFSLKPVFYISLFCRCFYTTVQMFGSVGLKKKKVVKNTVNTVIL